MTEKLIIYTILLLLLMKYQIIHCLVFFRLSYSTTINKSEGKTEIDEDVEENKPIVYTKSPAVNWKAKYSLAGRPPDTHSPKYENSIIMGSILVFLVYFCVLREENDIDASMGTSLYDKVPGLEENDLQNALAHSRLSQEERAKIEARLMELEQK